MMNYINIYVTILVPIIIRQISLPCLIIFLAVIFHHISRVGLSFQSNVYQGAETSCRDCGYSSIEPRCLDKHWRYNISA